MLLGCAVSGRKLENNNVIDIYLFHKNISLQEDCNREDSAANGLRKRNWTRECPMSPKGLKFYQGKSGSNTGVAGW